jgi:hypothetical protein
LWQAPHIETSAFGLAVDYRQGFSVVGGGATVVVVGAWVVVVDVVVDVVPTGVVGGACVVDVEVEVVVEVDFTGEVAACAGTITDCTTGRDQDFGNTLATAAATPMALSTGLRFTSSRITSPDYPLTQPPPVICGRRLTPRQARWGLLD